MNIKKIIIILSIIIFLSLTSYQLLPYNLMAENRGPEIFYDEELIKQKESYLNDITRKRKNTPAKKTPNIVLILADDLGKTDISLYGGKNIKTPNIDSIGQNGVTFTDAYCSSPVCSPSRAGLLTGRNQQRFGYDTQPMTRYPNNRLESNVYKTFMLDDKWVISDSSDIKVPEQKDIEKQGIPPTEILLPEILHASGYETAIIGKWHLGHNEMFIPINRGFQYHYGFYEAFSLYAPIDDPNIINHRHDYFASKHIWSQERKGTCAIRINDKPIEEKEYLTDKIAKKAIDFIKNNKAKPFFLYVPFSAPHTPFQATKEHYEKFKHVKDKNKRTYYAMISSLDEAVGKILKTIKDSNLGNDTIIFFSSDNGGATYTEATDNAPLKGGKMSNFEGGLNVPFMMTYQGKIKKGTIYKKPVSLLDIFHTSISSLPIKLPEDRKYDGTNLIPHITGKKKVEPHKQIFWKQGYNLAIRMGDWKLIIDKKHNKKILYNLADDKVEKINRIKDNSKKAEELLTHLKKLDSELKAPLWPGFMNFRFVIDGEEFLFAI